MIDVSILEVLARYDKAWLPEWIAKICEPMEALGLLQRDGEQWAITSAGREIIQTVGVARQ